MLKLAMAAAVTVVALAAVPAGQTRSVGTITACAHFSGHTYEACFAYIVNDSALALRQYYREANSEDPWDSADAAADFSYRFRGPAYRSIKQMVASWPLGVNTVYLPRITILSASASLTANRAVLTTRETWRVINHDGRVLLKLNNQLRRVTMCRIQGRLLHIWVVVKYSADPSFNCLAYPH